MRDERIMLAEGKAQRVLRLLTNALLYVTFSTVTGVLLKVPARKMVIGALLVLLAAAFSEIVQEKVSRFWLFALLHLVSSAILVRRSLRTQCIRDLRDLHHASRDEQPCPPGPTH